MKKPFWLAIALVGAVAVSRAQSAAPQPTPGAGQSDLGPSTANGSGMQLSTGTIEKYKAGEMITIRIDNEHEITLNLDDKVRLDGLVAEGRLAAVMWTETGGKRRVTSVTAAPGPGDSGTTSLSSSYQHMSQAPQSKTSVTPGPATLTPRAPTTPGATSTPRMAPRITPTAVP